MTGCWSSVQPQPAKSPIVIHPRTVSDHKSLPDTPKYRSADKSLAQPTCRCILFDGENISFDASLVIYINSTNIPPILIINRIQEHQNLLSL
jgi:hypothetical protein